MTDYELKWKRKLISEFLDGHIIEYAWQHATTQKWCYELHTTTCSSFYSTLHGNMPHWWREPNEHSRNVLIKKFALDEHSLQLHYLNLYVVVQRRNGDFVMLFRPGKNADGSLNPANGTYHFPYTKAAMVHGKYYHGEANKELREVLAVPLVNWPVKAQDFQIMRQIYDPGVGTWNLILKCNRTYEDIVRLERARQTLPVSLPRAGRRLESIASENLRQLPMNFIMKHILDHMPELAPIAGKLKAKA